MSVGIVGYGDGFLAIWVRFECGDGIGDDRVRVQMLFKIVSKK